MSYRPNLDYRQINQISLPYLPTLLREHLLPGGVQRGNEYVVRNPLRNDRHAGSFKINLITGRWSDFATGDAGGDIISLVAYLDGIPQREAARRLADMLGADYESVLSNV